MRLFLSTVYLTIFCLLMASMAKGQFSASEMRPKKSDIEIIKNNKLVIVLLKENEKQVEKMKKKGSTELEKYLNILKDFNENIPNLVSENFPFVSNVEYKTITEINNIIPEERKKFNFLTYNIGASVKINAAGPGVGAVVPKYDFYSKTVYSPLEKRCFDFEDKDASYGKIEIYVYDKKDKNGRIVFFKTLPHIIPSPGDLAYWLKRTNYIFESISKDEKSSLEKKKVMDNVEIPRKLTTKIHGKLTSHFQVPYFSA